MKGIIKWFTENSVAANLFMAFILIAGYFTIPKILMEIFPEPVMDIVTISVPYPGASPEEIEKSICFFIFSGSSKNFSNDAIDELICLLVNSTGTFTKYLDFSSSSIWSIVRSVYFIFQPDFL